MLLFVLHNNTQFCIIKPKFPNMTTKPGQQPVDEKTRDNFFQTQKTINDNNICIDCEKKNPKWASIHLGIQLCLDCAGKHRQYGVIYSFVKSINLDAWNRKQLLFMEKGGNSRALQYFKKRGVITANNRHIDYKSPIVQQYKALLTQQVELQLSGGVKVKTTEPEKKSVNDFFNEIQSKEKVQQKKVEIPVAEAVEQGSEKPKKKKDKVKKNHGKRIDIQDFESLTFDNGVSVQERDKIVKQYEKKKDVFQFTQKTTNPNEISASAPIVPKIQEPKELSQQEIKKKMQQLKQQSNLKTISSEQFRDNTIDNVTLKQNLSKFSGSTSISSSAFFNKQEQSNSSETMENIKDFVSNAGQKIFNKLSGLSSIWKK